MIAGTVLDKSGRPVSAAAITFAAAPVSMPDIALLSSADGSFALNAPVAGCYRLSIMAGERKVEVEVDVPAAGEANVRVEV